ncbi:MAG: NAD(P)-dependent oxidoreductase, partial [Muribaculaceae bacterium]|nr:NAD(P)-dependent oxidoreductase [Muribaculaceae bacterium]
DLNSAVKPISTADYPTPATRPRFSVLDKSLIKATYSVTIPHWREALREVLAILKENGDIDNENIKQTV